MRLTSKISRKLIMTLAGIGVMSALVACETPSETASTYESPAPTAESPAVEAPAATGGASPNSATGTTGSATAEGTVAELVSNNDSFSTLEEAIGAAGLETTLAQPGPITVFAPTDEAFAALPAEVREQLLAPENRDQLRQILTYHVVPESLPSTDLTTGEVNSAAGQPIAVTADPNGVTVNGATVSQPDIVASNGVIHAIDQVLLPPDLQNQVQ